MSWQNQGPPQQYPQHPGYPSQPPAPHGSPPQGYPPQGPPPKQGFRFQMWMLGLAIIPVGIGLSVVNILQKGTAEMGAGCSMNDDCVKGLQCIQIDGKSQCTKQCSSKVPGTSDLTCPAGFTCASVSMRAGTQDVPMEWCVGGE